MSRENKKLWKKKLEEEYTEGVNYDKKGWYVPEGGHPPVTKKIYGSMGEELDKNSDEYRKLTTGTAVGQKLYKWEKK